MVVNAKDAMAGKGKISIQTCIRETDSEKWSCVRVIDDGPGIPNNIAPLIFEPFFTTKSAGEGSGLGLPTAQGIVMQHGGKIWMERINEQTVFNVELPFCLPQNKIVEPEEFKGKHILLLEDDAMVRNILSEGLRNLGHRVMSFENGAEALHWLDENPSYPVDIAICDMVMPGLNGRQVGLQIAERFPQTKLIMMSGYTDEWNEEISQLLATRHFLQKPFSIAKLERTIRNLY